MIFVKYGLFILFALGTHVTFAGNSKVKIHKKDCSVYSGEQAVEWRGLTIKPGDIIDLEAVPAEDRLAFYRDIYMSLVKKNEVTIVDCTELE